MKRTHTLLGLGLVGAMIASFAGCVPTDAGDGEKSASDVLAAKTDRGSIPKGAIAVSDDVYAVPMAVDADGCEQFSEWSTLGVVRQIIYFRDGKGGFAAVKSPVHACNAEMVKTGVDDQGCATYRAEQPDGEATDVDYYRTESGYTANGDNAICEG